MLSLVWVFVLPPSMAFLGCFGIGLIAVSSLSSPQDLATTGAHATLWSHLSAWMATLLFGFQPVAQLATTWADLSRIHGLSIGTVALALAGNALMVPRALFTRDVIWLTGTLWGSLVMGWMQLVTFTVAGLLTGPTLGLVTLGMAAYYGAVLRCDMAAKGVAGLGTLAWDLLDRDRQVEQSKSKPY